MLFNFVLKGFSVKSILFIKNDKKAIFLVKNWTKLVQNGPNNAFCHFLWKLSTLEKNFCGQNERVSKMLHFAWSLSSVAQLVQKLRPKIGPTLRSEMRIRGLLHCATNFRSLCSPRKPMMDSYRLLLTDSESGVHFAMRISNFSFRAFSWDSGAFSHYFLEFLRKMT